jgi:hypothetical protein
MTTMHHELENWLTVATRGLPKATQEIIRAEIETHYEESVKEFEAEGMSNEAAHQETMKALGDVQMTANALRDTHLSDRRYILAAILSMVFPFVTAMLFSGSLGHSMTAQIIFLTSILLPMLYIMYAFKTLLAERFNADIRFAANLFSVSIFISAGASILGWLLLHQPVPIVASSQPIGFFESLLGYLNVGGDAVMAVAAILLSERLARLDNNLYGLRLPIRLTIIGCAYGLIGYVIAGFAQSEVALTLTSLVTIAIHVMLCSLWTLLFFRAVFRRMARPTQTA